MVDLQYAWKLPRRSWDQLTTCRAAVEQAFAALPADMKESVEVTLRICADALALHSARVVSVRR